MAKLFKLCRILTLAFCLVAIGAMAPMEEPDAVWGGDPDRVIEVFRTGKCESYSGGWGDFFKKVVITDGYDDARSDADGIIHVGVIPFMLDETILKRL